MSQVVSFTFLGLRTFNLATLCTSVAHCNIGNTTTSNVMGLSTIHLNKSNNINGVSLGLYRNSVRRSMVVYVFSVSRVRDTMVRRNVNRLILMRFRFLEKASYAISTSIVTSNGRSMFSHVRVGPSVVMTVFYFRVRNLRLFLSVGGNSK